MRKRLDKVEIQEPPIEELTKKRSCLKRSCWSGCGCLLLAIILLLGFLKFAGTPRAKKIKKIPESFPIAIPVYDRDSIEEIRFISGSQRNRALEIAAYIPKAILIPIYLGAEEYLPDELSNLFESAGDRTGWDKYVYLLRQPLTSASDIIEVEWRDLSAQPLFVQDFYATELEKEDFTVEVTQEEEDHRQITFRSDDIHGTLLLEDDPEESGTDQAILRVRLP